MTHQQNPELTVSLTLDGATEPTVEQGQRLAPEVATRSAWGERVAAFVSNPRAPFIFVAVVVLLCAGIVGAKYLPALGGRPNIVVFDPVRFANAQRAAASILATTQSADLTLMMTQVARQAEAVILDEAGGAVVLIKQAVVVPTGLVDITDAVLNRFGLPTSVPTVSTSLTEMSLDNLAPTDSSFSSGALKEDYRMELEARARKAAIERSKVEGQQAMLP